MMLIGSNFISQFKAFVLSGEPCNNDLTLPIVFNFEKDGPSLSMIWKSSTFRKPLFLSRI